MIEVTTTGTLGDSYICMCKMRKIKDTVITYHHTTHKYWYEEIKDIFSLSENTKVVFTEVERSDLEEITSDSHDGDMEFFPELKIRETPYFSFPYVVIQAHSGKVKGGNSKYVKKSSIERWMNGLNSKCILIGTSDLYNDFDHHNCINLVGKLSILDAISLVAKSNGFIGPEGLMSFVALSQKKDSLVMFTSEDAVSRRIRNTPWEKYASFLKIKMEVN
jgi:hypothetical protein